MESKPIKIVVHLKRSHQFPLISRFKLLQFVCIVSVCCKLSNANSAKILNYEDPTNYFEDESLSDKFNERVTFDQYVVYSMRSIALALGVDTDLHRYDEKSALIGSFARNLSYTDELGHLKARIAPSEFGLLEQESELTVLENELNQAKCGQQLGDILRATQKLYANFQSFSESKQLQLIDYLDSFGSISSQLMMGNSMWLGSYEQCSRSRLSIPLARGQSAAQGPRETIGARYCIAKFKSPNWLDVWRGKGERNEQRGSASIKLAVCLPETCNSISALRHGRPIEDLAKLVRLNQVPYSNFKLVDLYCLPDEKSPMRQFSLSARIFVSILSGWLTLVAYFSLKYEFLRMRWLELNPDDLRGEKFDKNLSKCLRIFSFRLSVKQLFHRQSSDEQHSRQLANHSSALNKQTCPDTMRHANMIGSLIRTKSNLSELNLSTFKGNNNNNNNDIINCNRLILLPDELLVKQSVHQSKGKSGSTMELISSSPSTDSLISQSSASSSPVCGRLVESKLQNDESDSEDGQRIKMTVSERESPKPAIELSAIEGIKVLSMVWLISAHTLLFFIANIANARDFWSILKDGRFMTCLNGIFPVDTFFVVTGILTAYLKFKKDNGQRLVRAKYWLECFYHRYLRFMPMYLIVFWYTRDVSEYIGLGPLWDYATADKSLRSLCKLESFASPMLFQANTKPLAAHCVKPAWYLANDYQFLLVTPIFLTLILRSTRLGYSIIILCIALSLILQFLTVFYADMTDSGTLINFKPMFGAYILDKLWRLYMRPYNRIAPYLIGLLTGHLLYSVGNEADDSKSEELKAVRAKNSTGQPGGISDISNTTSAPESTKTTTRTGDNGALNKSFIFSSAFCRYTNLNVWTPLALLISIIYSPMLTRIMTQQDGIMAKIGSSSIIALTRFIWSMAVARLIYICATRSLNGARRLQGCAPVGGGCSSRTDDSFVIRFLSSPIWKPWSKIGLSALLIQWEVISYLAQSQTSAPNLTVIFLLTAVLFCIMITYSLALLIYLTIEYPLSQIEQLYLHPTLFPKED